MSVVSSHLLFAIVVLALVGKQAVVGPQKIFARLVTLATLSGLAIVLFAEINGDPGVSLLGRIVMWLGMVVSGFMFFVASRYGLRQYMEVQRDTKELNKTTHDLLVLELNLKNNVRLESD